MPGERPPVEIGRVLDSKYHVTGLLGSGGMGIVYAATHLELGCPVAVKVIHEQYLDDPTFAERLLLEARVAARLETAHAMRVLDVGRLSSGAPYLVLERLEGHDLLEELERRGPPEVSTAVGIVLQACEAVAEAHALGIVHRDLKPENLFLARRGDGSLCVKVLDFGICKNLAEPSRALTAPHALLGSASYMSPEQMGGAAVDVRSDVWSLGSVLFELLTGHEAFSGPSFADIRERVLAGDAPSPGRYRPDLPPGLDAIVERCLQVDPARRFQSVGELARSLAQYAPAPELASVDRISRMLSAASRRVRTTLAAASSAPRSAERLAGIHRFRSRGGLRACACIVLCVAASGTAVMAATETETRLQSMLRRVELSIDAVAIAPPAALPAVVGISAEPAPKPWRGAPHQPRSAPRAPAPSEDRVQPPNQIVLENPYR